MGSHEHSMGSQLLGHIPSVQQSGDTAGCSPTPGYIWLWNSCQHNEMVKNDLCLQNRQTCTVIDTGGKEIPPPLLLLTSFKASDTTVQIRQSCVVLPLYSWNHPEKPLLEVVPLNCSPSNKNPSEAPH